MLLTRCRLAALALISVVSAPPLRAQFLPPGILHPGATVDSGEDVQVDHLVTSKGVFHAVWASQNDYTGSSGSDPDLFYSRNTGSGWSWPVLVNSYGSADNGVANDDREPRLAMDGKGRLHCVWQSTYPWASTGSDWDVFYATFDGTAWSPALAAPGAVGDAGDDTLPTLVGLGNGGVLVAWEAPSGGGDRDVVSSVIDLGFWSIPVEIARGAVAESGDDLGPVALALDAEGTVIAAWSTDDPQISLGTDRDVVMAERPAGGDWSFMTEVSALARFDTGDDRAPALAVVGRGADREVHVVWTSDEPHLSSGTDRDLFHAVQRFPSTIPPQNPTYLVNSNAVGDAGDDVAPALCVEPGGTVHVVWQTADAFIGDQDVLHSTNATPGGAWSPFELLGINGFFDHPGDDDSRPDVACAARGFVSGAWQSKDDLGGLVGPDHDIFHAVAPDRGISRPDSVRQDADFDPGDDLYPAAAVDVAGRLHVVWASDDPGLAGGTGSDFDLFYSVLESGIYSVPELVNVNGIGSESGADAWPTIVVDREGIAHVAWASNESIAGSGTDFDIFYARRDPGGWTAPELVHTSGLSDGGDPGPGDFAPKLLLASDQTLQILWSSNLRTSPLAADLSWARRTATGWSPEEPANSAWVGLGYTPHFCATLDLYDEPQVVWASDVDTGGLGSDLDLFFTTRQSGIWSNPLVLFDPFSDGFAADGACDLAFDAPGGNLWLVWATDFNAGGSGGDRDLFVGWRDALFGSWESLGPLLSLGTGDTGLDDDPRLLAFEGQLAVVWRSQENLGFTAGSDDDLFYAVLDPAAGFPSPATVRLANASGHADGDAQDEMGGIALSRSGDLHVVWSSYDDLGGTIEGDLDILHATLPLVEPLFADGFESGDTSAWDASVP